MIYTLKNEYYNISISDVGAEIVSIKSPKGYEFLWQGGEGLWSMQAPLLFPLCGSYADRKYTILGEVRPIALHGFALSSKFELIKATDSSLEFVLRANDKTRESFPFEFELFVSYSLNGEDIRLDAKIKNLSDITMPYMFGWHPGFNLPFTAGAGEFEDYYLEFATPCTLMNEPIDKKTLRLTGKRVRLELEDDRILRLRHDMFIPDGVFSTTDVFEVTLKGDCD